MPYSLSPKHPCLSRRGAFVRGKHLVENNVMGRGEKDEEE
jgi:hypothetical protein